MKRLAVLLVLVFSTFLSFNPAFGLTPFWYNGIAIDGSGQILDNATVNVRVTILSGSSVLGSQTFLNQVTDQFGSFSLEVNAPFIAGVNVDALTTLKAEVQVGAGAWVVSAISNLAYIQMNSTVEPGNINLTPDWIIMGDAYGNGEAVPVGGELTGSNLGSTAVLIINDNAITNNKMADNSVGSPEIINGSIINEDIAALAGIEVTKLAAGGADQFLVNNGTNVWADFNRDLTLVGNGVGTAVGLNLANANTWTGQQIFTTANPQTPLAPVGGDDITNKTYVDAQDATKWSITGNSGLTAGTNFIGTTDAVDLVIKVNNLEYGRLTAALDNVSIGRGALTSSPTGGANSAYGHNALQVNTTGHTNSAFGLGSLTFNTSGIYNTGLGGWALYSNVFGNRNVAVGSQALKFNQFGNNNTAVGELSLNANVTGSNNTVLGSGADVSADGFTNATALGYGAIATASNQVRLGNASVTSLYSMGATAGSTNQPNMYVDPATGQIMQSTTLDRTFNNLTVNGNTLLGTNFGNNVDIRGMIVNNNPGVDVGINDNLTIMAPYSLRFGAGQQVNGIVTAIGTPGTDASLPTEKAVRDAINVSNSYPFITVGNVAGLTAERAIGTNSTLTGTDGGANAAYTLGINLANSNAWDGVQTLPTNVAQGDALINSINSGSSTINTARLDPAVVLETENPAIGDISGSYTAGFQIVADAVGPTELAATTVTPNPYGSATAVPTFTVDADGRLTAAADVPIAIPPSQITGGSTGDIIIMNGTPSWRAVTGDIILTGTGATTIQADAVTSAKILNGTILDEDIANATISNGKLANSTIGLTSSGSITVGSSPISLGGSGSVDLNLGNPNSWSALQTFVDLTTTGNTTLGDNTADNVYINGMISNNLLGTDVLINDNLTIMGTNALRFGSGQQVNGIVTTIGTPGSDASLPTEKAVRDAVSATTTTLQSYPYITVGNVADLTNERAIGVNSTLTATDGGANGAYTLGINLATGNTWSGQQVFGTANPQTPLAPAAANDLTNKNYVDTQIGTRWGITGNAGLTAGTNFIGTTDNVDLVFKVANLPSGIINSDRSETALGFLALQQSTGSSNTAMGMFALGSVTTGYGNSAFGAGALTFNTANTNSAFGYNALYNNTTGSQNTAMGMFALTTNVSGFNNSAFGMYALLNSTGNDNTGVGASALSDNTSGSQNTALGAVSLRANTTGTYNTSIGRWTMMTNLTGSYNTVVGANSDVSADGLTNVSVLGYGVTANASNQVRLGNASVTSLFSMGATAASSSQPNMYVDAATGQIMRSTTLDRTFGNLTATGNTILGTDLSNTVFLRGMISNDNAGVDVVIDDNLTITSPNALRFGSGQQVNGIVTTIGTPGTDASLPTEKAVRDAITTSATTIQAYPFLTIGNDAGLTNERAIAHDATLSATDGGANGSYTLGLNLSNANTWLTTQTFQTILPSADATYDLGSSTQRWRDLYLSGASINMGTNANNAKVGYDGTNFTFDKPISFTSGGLAMVTKDTWVAGNVGNNTDNYIPIWSSSSSAFMRSNIQQGVNGHFVNFMDSGLNLDEATSKLEMGVVANADITKRPVGYVMVNGASLNGGRALSAIGASASSDSRGAMVVWDRNVDGTTPIGGVAYDNANTMWVNYLGTGTNASLMYWKSTTDYGLSVGTSFLVNQAGAVTATSFSGPLTGNVTGNASTATTLQTARDFSITGDVTAAAVSFNGSANVALASTVASVGGVSASSIASGVNAANAAGSIQTQTANYTATTTDGTILVDATAAAITITLPAANTMTGRKLIIKKIDAAANSVTIDGNGAETIDGAATQTLATQWLTMVIQSNGTSWFIIN